MQNFLKRNTSQGLLNATGSEIQLIFDEKGREKYMSWICVSSPLAFPSPHHDEEFNTYLTARAKISPFFAYGIDAKCNDGLL